jgi:D-aspartate ligase
MNRGKALACVIGGMDLVRPLGLAGIRCAVVAKPGSPALYSRFTQVALHWDHSAENMDKLVEALISFGAAQLERPVLFYETDAHLLLVSQYRERLAQVFRFVVADSLLVQNLVDKARFYALAERLQLQIPATRCISPVEGSKPTDIDLLFPVIIKPVTRRESWRAIGGSYKALQVDNPKTLKELWSRVIAQH